MKLISGDGRLCSHLNLAAAGDPKGAVQGVQAAVASTGLYRGSWLSRASRALMGSEPVNGERHSS